MLAVFALVESLDVPLLTAPSPLLGTALPTAAVTSLTLLMVDVALPVPSGPGWLTGRAPARRGRRSRSRRALRWGCCIAAGG